MIYAAGDHLKSPRTAYTHHAIYVGDSQVVEKTRQGVRLVSLDEFCEGNPIEVVPHHDRAFSRDISVRRALSRLDEREYNLLNDNCEHFVNWCISGEERSEQVLKTVTTAAGIAAGAIAVAGVVRHQIKKNGLNLATAAAGVASAGTGGATAVLLRTAITAGKVISAAGTAKTLGEIVRDEGFNLGSAVKMAAVAAGVDKDNADKLGKGMSKAAAKTGDLARDLWQKKDPPNKQA